MKIDWSFVVAVLVIGFALGFLKPYVSADLHLLIALVSYGVTWFFYRSKSGFDAQKIYDKWSRWIIYIVVLYGFAALVNKYWNGNTYANVVYFAYMIFGAIFCSSERIRGKVLNLFKEKK